MGRSDPPARSRHRRDRARPIRLRGFAEAPPATWRTIGARWTQCRVLWGNGVDLPGFSNEFFTSEDGKLQAAVIVNVNPIPKAVSGEPLGATRTTAIADALGSEHC
jgi:hypothetical protein